MPYRVQGRNVLHKKGGKWTVKQRCKTVASAHAAIRLLRGIEHNPKFEKAVRRRQKRNYNAAALARR